MPRPARSSRRLPLRRMRNASPMLQKWKNGSSATATMCWIASARRRKKAMCSPICSPLNNKETAMLADRRNYFLMFAVVVLLMGGMISAAQAEDDDDDEHMPTARNALWQTECGSCHVAYPPRLLPAESWRAVMSGLDKHFGSDASLDPAAVREIGAFL